MTSYTQLLRQGAFPKHIDPWAEKGLHFHPLHNSMISSFLRQIGLPLIEMGYVAGRETSLQISEARIPDANIRDELGRKSEKWDFVAATKALDLELGVLLHEDETDLDAISIKEAKTGEVVTVIEIISPTNKVDWQEIYAYQARRKRLLQNSVNVVEIDFSRSIKRMVQDKVANDFAYHIAVHLEMGESRLWGMTIFDTPKSFPLPLRGEAFAVDSFSVYRQAYEEVNLAWHILQAEDYRLEELPFPTLINAETKRQLLSTVETWRENLEKLRPQDRA